MPLVKYWEIIADNLSKAGWSWGYVSTVDSRGRTIFVVDAHRGDGKEVRQIVAGSSGNFADSLAVFAVPKRIGLRSHIRLSSVLIKLYLITLPDVSTHFWPG